MIQPASDETRLVWDAGLDRSDVTPGALARGLGHDQLAEQLRPQPVVALDDDTLADLEIFLWALVEVRTRHLGRRLRPPQLGPLLEHRAAARASRGDDVGRGPRHVRGFACRWAQGMSEPTVEVRSWSRVIGGSSREHHITVEGIELVARGLL